MNHKILGFVSSSPQERIESQLSDPFPGTSSVYSVQDKNYWDWGISLSGSNMPAFSFSYREPITSMRKNELC